MTASLARASRTLCVCGHHCGLAAARAAAAGRAPEPGPSAIAAGYRREREPVQGHPSKPLLGSQRGAATAQGARSLARQLSRVGEAAHRLQHALLPRGRVLSRLVPRRCAPHSAQLAHACMLRGGQLGPSAALLLAIVGVRRVLLLIGSMAVLALVLRVCWSVAPLDLCTHPRRGTRFRPCPPPPPPPCRPYFACCWLLLLRLLLLGALRTRQADAREAGGATARARAPEGGGAPVRGGHPRRRRRRLR
mmetsp:Transcript_36661/g.92937  ORF Transcript_36661/g.92937 Transcript_36661/m.92937 type:complete len:249 (+) Transcript_36661:741-1487(+)